MGAQPSLRRHFSLPSRETTTGASFLQRRSLACTGRPGSPHATRARFSTAYRYTALALFRLLLRKLVGYRSAHCLGMTTLPIARRLDQVSVTTLRSQARH